MFHFGFVSRANELKDFQIHEFPFASPLQYFLSLYVLCLGRCFVALTQIKILVSSLTIVFCFTSIALFVQNVLVVFISECKAGRKQKYYNNRFWWKEWFDPPKNLRRWHGEFKDHSL